MPSEKGNIVWSYGGKTDVLLGNGATKAETLLVWLASLAGAGLIGFFWLTHAYPWDWWQYLLAALIAFDVLGGVVANSLNSCKRFYHSPTKSGEPVYAKNHLLFSAIHVYPLLAAFLFGGSHPLYGVFWYVFLLAGTLIILKTPLYLRRPAAFLLIVAAAVINLYFILPVAGFEWLVPALFLKLFYGHLVQEEPYRPNSETAINTDLNS